MSEKHDDADSKGGKGGAPAAAGGGGMKAMLPLIISIVLMPVMAYVMTAFVLLPKLKASASAGAATGDDKTPPAESAKGDGHGDAAKADAKDPHGAAKKEPDAKLGAADSGGHGGGGAGKGATKVALNKIVVNVSGTMGTRYLMTSVTLVGVSKDFKDVIEENKDKLLDLASGSLATKTIADLEKPGARNNIRSELLTLFNNSLPSPLVKELFITDMAVQ